ncbi:MAG TPA: hypothetical protein DF712_23485 [Balneola sp.]|nr:hypothetical protein [Bacteroidota bacterium]HCT55420.1 hypothetical protein [Balneola sp.]|tara:strand:- start:3012 stop:3830 length:819 start_codon:yes stop_codon:yes gene_type:complete
MFKFFRRVRQALLSESKFSKYLLYALGEIVLVMIGILLALQVNNWNEQRKLSRELDSFASAMIHDLENDITALDIGIRQTKAAYLLLDSLITYSRNLQNINEAINIDVYLLSSRNSYRAIAWSRSTFEELKNSGALRYVENDSLLSLLNRYEALTYHLDKDLTYDDESAKIFGSSIRKVIDFNYPQSANLLPNWYNMPVDGIPDFNTLEHYQKYRSNDLELLTDNLNELKIAVNHAIPLSFGIRIRAENEFPNAKQMATKIIQLLRKEYELK